MNGILFAVVVILVLVGKIREGMKNASANESTGFRRLPESNSGEPSGETFSLQNVLAEIQKVKDQAQRTDAMSGAQLRERIQRNVISAQKKKELTERAGQRRESLQQVSIETPKDSGPSGREAGPARSSILENTPSNPASPVEGGPVAIRPPAGVSSGLTIAQLRDAAIWREILSPPVSMREE